MQIPRRLMLSGTVVARRRGTSQVANPAGLRLLTSTDRVQTPPKGAMLMKLSSSNPEPSVEFAGLVVGFEAITFENYYRIDPERVTVERGDDRLVLRADGLTWVGGGTPERAGSLTATVTAP